MKSKGENRRFMDETGYLLDGIEDESGTKGFRRARYDRNEIGRRY
jgi:hypothetical protein